MTQAKPKTPTPPPVRELPPPTLPPPARRAWEEPPPDGWASGWTRVGLEFLRLIATCGIAFAAVALARTASALHHRESFTRSLLWAGVALLVVAVAAFLWRRLGGITLLGAMLGDFGRVARFGGRPPVWLDGPPAQKALRVAHLSDLHVVEADNIRIIERDRPGGNARLRLLLDAPSLLEADVLLFTGDVTDRGTSLSWRAFLDALEERGLANRTVLVPGNHDIAYIDDLGRRVDRFGIIQLANLLKFAEAFAETRGGRLGRVMYEKEVRQFAAVWEDVEREVRPLVASLPTTPVPPLTLRRFASERGPFAAYLRRIERARHRLLRLFPVAVPVADDAVVFVLNSASSPSWHPATNAFGRIGRLQYRRLRRLATATGEGVRLVALHHHVVRRPEESSAPLRTRFLGRFTVLADPRPLVRFCRDEQVRAVFNGHRHVSYQVRLPSGTVLLAAPSSTFGDELSGDLRAQFDLYDVLPASEGASCGIFRAPVRIS